ncbi:hypothetical protein D3C73_1347580 [compost metagenome]
MSRRRSSLSFFCRSSSRRLAKISVSHLQESGGYSVRPSTVYSPYPSSAWQKMQQPHTGLSGFLFNDELAKTGTASVRLIGCTPIPSLRPWLIKISFEVARPE